MKKQPLVFSVCLAVLALGSSTVFAADDLPKQAVSEGTVGFVADDNPGDTSDPNTDHPEKPNPDPDPERPGGTGPLSFTHVPAFDFGTDNKLTSGAKVLNPVFETRSYHTAAGEVKKDLFPHLVTVEDVRGTSEGWTVSVSNNGKFTSGGSSFDGYLSLDGSEMALASQSFDPTDVKHAPRIVHTDGFVSISSGSSVELFRADKGKGDYKWSLGIGSTLPQNGVTPQKNEAIKLEIAKDQVINTKKVYKTTVNWELNNIF